MAKPSLVGYRRTSSDMDMSSTDEEDKNELEKVDSQSQNNGTSKPAKCDDSSVKDNSSSKDDRLRDDRRENERKESRSRDSGRRDRRKESSDTKAESGSADRRKRKSPERSRRHRSRSPGRRKHSSRDRKRSHSPEHRSRKTRRSSRSPDMYRSKRLERKVARIDKLGLEVFNDLKPGQSSGFYNAGGGPASRITEQIQKRRLLWGAKKETPPVGETETAGTSKNWEAATFKGDNDGRMTEKFKRLMGIKGDGVPAASSKAGSSLIQKQEEMFSQMEAEYQVARMATHTHRGIGLGFGTFQVPPR